MSRREKDKQASLDALAKIAYASGGGAPAPTPKPQTAPSSLPRAPPKPAPAAPSRPKTLAETEAEKKRRQQIEERRAKLEEEQRLKQRRANELARSTNIQRRGMDDMGVPSSIRRTGYDRQEATVAQKLHDILGETKIKESREKARDKGRRQGGR